ncbi:MAG: hypothetical protein WB781_05195 [Candidatus Sulfotelmatobacter sp.]
MTQISQRSTLNEIVLQLTRIPPGRVGGRDHRVRADERESQRGHHMYEVEFRPIMAGNGESVTESFLG